MSTQNLMATHLIIVMILQSYLHKGNLLIWKTWDKVMAPLLHVYKAQEIRSFVELENGYSLQRATCGQSLALRLREFKCINILSGHFDQSL